MLGYEFAVHHHVRPGSAQVAGRPLTRLRPTKELHFGGDREILVFRHGFRALTMDHDAAVAPSPPWSAFDLLPEKPVFAAEDVVGAGRLVEEVPEPVFKFSAVSLVSHLDHAILYSKGVPEIFAECVTLDLRSPALEALAIEELDPSLLTLSFLEPGEAESGEEESRRNEERQDAHGVIVALAGVANGLESAALGPSHS